MEKPITKKHLFSFFLLTFAFSWGIPAAGLILAGLIPSFSFSLKMYTPFYFIAVWGPAISAFLIMLKLYGLKGVRSYAARILDWKIGGFWWIFALIGIPAIYFSGALLELAMGTADSLSWYRGSWFLFVFLFFLRATAGPVEEFGWRGFAQPLMQRYMSPVKVVIVLALIHSLWHAPAFIITFASDTHFASSMPLPAALARFTANIFIITVFMNIAYNSTGGRITSAFLIHWMLNGFYPWKGTADFMTGQTIVAGFAAIILLTLSSKWLKKKNSVTFIIALEER